MATPPKTTTTKPAASEGTVRPRRVPRLRTNVVVGEDADGRHHCVYAGPSADRALSEYADLRHTGGEWDCRAAYPDGPLSIRFVRAVCSIDPKASDYCSFAG